MGNLIIDFSIKVIKTKNSYSLSHNIIQLHNNDIAYCIYKNSIAIIDSFTLEIKYSLQELNSAVTCIVEMDNSTIISGSEDSLIIIWKIKEKQYIPYFYITGHKESVSNIRVISNNRFISSSDNTIKIWKGIEPYVLIKTIKIECDYVYYYNDNFYDYLLTASKANSKLIIWSMNSYQQLTTFLDIGGLSYNSYIKINNRKILLGNQFCLIVMNMKNISIEKRIIDDLFGKIFCFTNIRNNQVLIGCERGNMFLLDNSFHYGSINSKAHLDDIFEIIAIDDNTLISISKDRTLKLWKINHS